MNMRNRIFITILLIVLGLLIVKFGGEHLGLWSVSKTVESQKESMEVIRLMMEMENSKAYEEYLEELAQLVEGSSCSPYYLQLDNDITGMASSTEKINIDTDKGLPSYTKLYPELYVEKLNPEATDKTKKIAYLTFDDGPSKNTTKILEILKEKNAVATFFVLGCTITEDGEEALKEMVEMGCAIGIHTYSHERKKIYSSVESYLEDFNKVYTQVYDITGERPQIFRFPWGSYNCYSKGIKKDLVTEMERRGFTYYDWNVSAEDSVGNPTEASIMRNILKDVKKYSAPVILMHDASVNKKTVEILPKVIDKLIELGYEFGTLEHREPCQFCY